MRPARDTEPPDPDDRVAAPVATVPTRASRALMVLWPAFVVAGVLEALLFVVLEPTALRVSANAAYSLVFLVLWLAIAGANVATQWLLALAARNAAAAVGNDAITVAAGADATAPRP